MGGRGQGLSRVKVGVGFWRSSLALKREEEEEGRQVKDFRMIFRGCAFYRLSLARSLPARKRARPLVGRSPSVGENRRFAA